MTEELQQLLSNLKLHRMHAVYDEQLRAAELQQITYTDFVAGLLRAQWRDRQEYALEWRIRRAVRVQVYKGHRRGRPRRGD